MFCPRRNQNLGPYATRGLLFVSVAILIGPESSILHAQQYTIQAINDVVPSAINDSSQIVGNPQNSVAFASLWDAGTITQIAPPGLTEPFGRQINNSGQVVGLGINAAGWWQGFLWKPGSGFVDMSVPDGQIPLPSSINDIGEVGGAIQPQDGSSSIACIWTSPQNLVLLPSLGTGGAGVAALNNSGQAVGDSGDMPPGYPGLPGGTAELYGDSHAVLWQNGNVIDLTPDDPSSSARDINNHGEVVGWLVDPTTQKNITFEWNANDGLTELPSSSGAAPFAINDEGQIVGITIDPTGSTTSASLWEDGMLYDLNDLVPDDSGWVLQQAYDINDLGQIVGQGTYDGQYAAFLLTPVPEPVAISLAAGFYFLANRRPPKGLLR
jgi:probable HAF family extracellular repeat protein